ncbi:hypothetical protein [Oceanicaulis sp. UBA2681]|uniref:hypothetical protein n=1 Tax=Oceanicaulis sp. UBA2681 TaxID=1947007 RepID=UPI00257E528E|nr:hypothetical protein [Oceanicaulis sp. UBA2681]
MEKVGSSLLAVFHSQVDLYERLVVPLGWQITMIVLFVSLRRPIKDLIDRIEGFSWKGSAVNLASKEHNRAKQQEISKPLSEELAHEKDPTLKHIYDALMHEVEQKNFVREKEVLVDQIAVERRANFSNHLLRLIYLSQLELFFYMRNEGYASDAVVLNYFNSHKSKAPKGLVYNDVESWLWFLRSYNLVTGTVNRLELTPWGESFVAFCQQINLNTKSIIFP